MGISIGLVGLGTFGSAFADLFKSHPLVSRVALCDKEPELLKQFARKESFSDKFRVSDAYTSFDDILNADLDALAIITQPWLHAEQAVRAMKAGKHVYSAVPIVSLPDGDEILDWCDKIIETCRNTGMFYMLGETTYYRPQAMYCRKKAREGAFGEFVHAEGDYFHDLHHGLSWVRKQRTGSTSGKEWIAKEKKYLEKGILSGPMHYPTHSVCGPVCIMNAHMKKVCAWGFEKKSNDEYFCDSNFSNETALFTMSNNATARICEYREIGSPCREMFNILGTKACFYGEDERRGDSNWYDLEKKTALSVDEMREPLPDDIYEAFKKCSKDSDIYGGHGGSHAYLVHEFVDAIVHERQPTINAWEAVRYMVPGVMAHKSAEKKGLLMDVPDWGDAPT